MAAKPLITLVVGARPNFMKAAPLVKAMTKDGGFAVRLVHTGQHFDVNMSKVFFDELGLPEPDVFLNVNTGSPNTQIAKIMLELEEDIAGNRSDLVIVFGDVNSTLAAAMTANKLGIQLAHVEAGLRSFDSSMPEEHNRVVTDHLSNMLFTPSPEADENLIKEGIPPVRIHRVGNIMVDSLLTFRGLAETRDTYIRLGLRKQNYALVTLHRQSNVDTPQTLRGLLSALYTISQRIPVIFPIHPRTRQRISEFGLDIQEEESLRFIDPVSYIDFLNLMINARLVVTDSGGIQEETTVLGIKCLTLRNNTERPITVTQGTNRLAGITQESVTREALLLLEQPQPEPASIELWDGKTAERIINVLCQGATKV